MSTTISTISPGLAETYDATKTYAKGAYVLWQNAYWKCKDGITSAEAWTASHWTKDYDVLSGIMSSKADLVNGKIPASQLPSYVDDVLEFDSLSDFPVTGESGKIYVAKDTNRTYRWSGSTYIQVGGEEITLDDTVTQTSSNGVKSSGIYTAIENAVSTRCTIAEVGDGKWRISDVLVDTTTTEVKYGTV